MRTNARAEPTAPPPPSAGDWGAVESTTRFFGFIAGSERFLTADFLAIFSSPNDARERRFHASPSDHREECRMSRKLRRARQRSLLPSAVFRLRLSRGAVCG